MKNTGYVIAKNKGMTEFFTSSSAYDRPRWVSLAEATTYPTAEMAQTASTKLYKSSGSYEARFVSVQELREALGRNMSYAEQPYDDNDPEGIMPDGEVDAGDEDDDKMVAKQQGADPSIDPDADDEVGLETDRPEDDIDQGEVEDMVDQQLGDDDMIDDPTVGMPGEDDELDDLPDVGFDEEDPEADPRLGVTESVDELSVEEIGPDPDVATPHEEKVSVPANVKKDLKAAIANFEKQAKFANTRDDARASFCMTVAEAFSTLLELLDRGTVESIKLAQIQLTSWMNPITTQLPSSVYKFVLMGGKKASLKDLFDSKRESRKAD